MFRKEAASPVKESDGVTARRILVRALNYKCTIARHYDQAEELKFFNYGGLVLEHTVSMGGKEITAHLKENSDGGNEYRIISKEERSVSIMEVSDTKNRGRTGVLKIEDEQDRRERSYQLMPDQLNGVVRLVLSDAERQIDIHEGRARLLASDEFTHAMTEILANTYSEVSAD